VGLDRDQRDSDRDHGDPETGCTDGGDEQDCAGEHECHGNPDQWLPHGCHLPTWFVGSLFMVQRRVAGGQMLWSWTQTPLTRRNAIAAALPHTRHG
jgi:hypothetical protein